MKKVALNPNEKVILKSKGGLNDGSQSRWRMGEICLTNERLLFLQPFGITCEIALSSMDEVGVEKKDYAFGQKNALFLKYKHNNEGNDKHGTIWVVTPELDRWKEKLCGWMLIQVTEEDLGKVCEKLDPDSERIVWHFWEVSHARIDELATLIGASAHMDVLIKIRNEINKVASEILGYPLLTFDVSKKDPETEKDVTYSWWLIGRGGRTISKETFCDVFDEGKQLVVVVELLGVDDKDLDLQIDQKRIRINNSSNGNCEKEVFLPVEIVVDKIQQRFNNGILEIRATKRG
ncbi:Hsp20/alpha crystallin family protein [bacterium]|nr:Hsp20/alpha crystallin family protein [bacterium]